MVRVLLRSFARHYPQSLQSLTFAPLLQLQDGLCGSSCSNFAEMMKTLSKVRSVTVGGRANNYPMAGVFGTRGSVMIPWNLVYQYSNLVYDIATTSDKAYINGTDVGKIMSATQALTRAASGGTAAHLNGANNIRKGEDKPLHFIWEAADEKIFNTAAMILDPVPAWQAAVDCGFNKKGCVKTVAPKNWNSAAGPRDMMA